jgi:hypothetical protein
MKTMFNTPSVPLNNGIIEINHIIMEQGVPGLQAQAMYRANGTYFPLLLNIDSQLTNKIVSKLTEDEQDKFYNEIEKCLASNDSFSLITLSNILTGVLTISESDLPEHMQSFQYLLCA